LGREIRRQRKAKGWTLAEFSEASGLHPSYIAGIERADRNVGMAAIFKLARGLAVHPADLLSAIP
jgi:transcriptional regulator with XRE-family HTH domain